LSRADFAALPEVESIVNVLKGLEATKFPFYVNDESRLLGGMAGGVQSAFSVANNYIYQFFAGNGLSEHFPFVYRGKTEQTDGEPDLVFTDKSVDKEVPIVIGDFKPVTYNSRAHTDSKKAHATATHDMKTKHAKEIAANEVRKGKGISPILQVFDYTVTNGVQFGMLVTYAHLWLCIRDCKKHVVIVEAFSRDCCPIDGSMSVVQALVVFLLLAQRKMVPPSLIKTKKLLVACPDDCDHTATPTAHLSATQSVAPATGSSSTSSSSGGGERKKNKTKGKGKGKNAGGSSSKKNTLTINDQDQNAEDVSIFLYNLETGVYGKVQHEFIPGARTGTMKRHRTSSGLDSVSKKADLYKKPDLKAELQNEATAYIKMRDLQGSAIPDLKGYGFDPRAHFMYTLTTSHGGVPLSEVEGVFEEEKALALKALDAVHAAGVLHRDIKAENILVERGVATMPGKVKLVDFAFAKMDDSDAMPLTNEKSEAKLAFEVEAAEERLELLKLLQALPTVCGAAIDKGWSPRQL
jgi:hypothetical protein